MEYEEFLQRKTQLGNLHGFEPLWMPDFLFDFQKYLVEWSLLQGRGAEFADCGLGKTPMELVWAQNVLQKTNKPVIVITPLAVSHQTIREGEKFNIECHRSRDGKIGAPSIYVTNYEKLHLFNRHDFGGAVCDESSAIKNFEGERQKIVTEFMREIPYRLLGTATAAPNDYIELLTSAEALGEIGRMDGLGMFFRNDENSLHPIWWGARWQFKAHAEEQFWRWVCSWARCVRTPSDLGFDDGRFILPELITNEIVVERDVPLEGVLFQMPAITLEEQQAERKQTIKERCHKVLEMVSAVKGPSVSWCHTNAEADLLEKIIPGSKQVAGRHSDEEKEETFLAFATGQLNKLITKARIGGFGLNWQHCRHMTQFPSHSFEQYYQTVRRCWRFGQECPVTVDMITTPGELGVMKNMQRKADQADKMFTVIVKEMNNALRLERSHNRIQKEIIPSWL